MRKVKISEKDTMYSTDDFYTPRKAQLDKEMRKLWILGGVVALIVGITYVV